MSSQAGRLYVVDNLRHIADAKAGDKTWWCVEHSTAPGEDSAIYLKGRGIKVLFRTEGPAESRNTFCDRYGMATAPVEVITVFERPLAAQALRTHPILRNLPALGRNFQGRSFRLPATLFEEMRQLGAELSAHREVKKT